jgi:uncharacterized membrane protein (DUF2068 family)
MLTKLPEHICWRKPPTRLLDRAQEKRREAGSQMSTPASIEKSTHITFSDRWLVAIGVLKLFKAVLFILLGIGAIQLLHKDLVDEVTRFIISLRFDPEGRVVNLVLDKVALINPHRLKEISVGIFAYAALDIIEGMGLVFRRVWAEYVTLILTASFLPWEVFEIIRHVTGVKIVLTLLNVLVVLYLIYHVQSRSRQRQERAT